MPENHDERSEPTFTLAFEYDLTYYGGNYDDVGAFVFIPVSLINEAGGPERAFRQFTGYSSCHIIHYDDNEEEYNQEYGVLEEQVSEQDRQLHYGVCEVCAKIGVRQAKQKG